MAGTEGNKNAEKYPPKKILEIVDNCMQGLASFKSYEEKQEFAEVKKVEMEEGVVTPTVIKGDKKTRIIEGYSCLKRALISNKIYDESKLHEWLTTHTNEINKDKEDSIAVSQAIKELLLLGHYMLEINTLEGHYAPAVGIFFGKAVLHMRENHDEDYDEEDDDFEGFEFKEIEPKE